MDFDLTILTPDEEQQERLHRDLKKIVRKRGWQHFVSGLRIEPSHSFFPDIIQPNVGGIRRIIHRLMVYADIGDLNPCIELYDAQIFSENNESQEDMFIAGLFAGIENGDANFGLDIFQTMDEEGLIGVLCHEVTHAYRHHFQLEISQRNREEKLNDLTSVYLGFGILMANASYLFRTEKIIEDSWVYSYWSARTAGYLNPQELCYLLALQSVIRGDDFKKIEHIRRQLGVDQSAMFYASYKLLSSEQDNLRHTFGVPTDENLWPKQLTLNDAFILKKLHNFKPLSGDSQSVIVEEVFEEELDDPNRPTFRVKKSRLMLGIFISSTISFLLGGLQLITNILESIIAILFIILSGFLGSFFKFYTCSSTECENQVAITEKKCPGCGRQIAGTIKSINDRLEAEDSLDN